MRTPRLKVKLGRRVELEGAELPGVLGVILVALVLLGTLGFSADKVSALVLG